MVNDIEKYPEFLPGCSAAEVSCRSADHMEASLELAAAGLHYRLRTRNQLFAPHRIHMEMLDGPFESLSGEWSFRPVADFGSAPGCEVRLQLRFRCESIFLRSLAGRFAESLADRLVHAMCARAEHLYAPANADVRAAADIRQTVSEAGQ